MGDRFLTINKEGPYMLGFVSSCWRMFRALESTYLPLVILWLIGAIWGGFEIYDHLPDMIKPSEAGGFTKLFWGLVVAQLIAGLVHQLLVFRSIHVFDSESGVWSQRFPNWIGTNIEWGLRVLILLSLLMVGGEIPLLLKDIRDTLHTYHVHDVPIYTYPLSSVCLYSLLLVWDVWGACRASIKIRTLCRIFPQEYRQEFFLSDLLCLLFWIAMSVLALQLPFWAATLFLAALFAIAYFAMILYRVGSHFGWWGWTKASRRTPPAPPNGATN